MARPNNDAWQIQIIHLGGKFLSDSLFGTRYKQMPMPTARTV